MKRLQSQICEFIVICLVLSAFWSSPALVPVLAQPTGYQEYYVLGYEEHARRAFLAINDGSPPTELADGYICSTVSLVATADFQIIYYDHWEDGYEADLLNPVQSTTRVYGDGDPSNGGQGNDILYAGDDLTLTSDQGVGGATVISASVPVSPTRTATRDLGYIRYDGGDRIMTSGGPVNLTHAMWPLDNSWIGGAWEVPSRQAYRDTYVYRVPIGQDLYQTDSSTFGDFRNVYLELLSFEDNTTISIDNGSDVVNLTLDRGQAYFSGDGDGYINSTVVPSITINSGTVVRSNKPTQVGLMTGSAGSFQGRFLIVLPDKLLGADYVVPVPSGNAGVEAEVYLSNPNDFPITVYAYDLYTQTMFTVSPTTTVAYSSTRGGYVPADSAARFTSPDGVFGVVVCADTARVDYDWGFTGMPAQYLTSDYYISWSPGSDNIPPTENGSPVWVTPLANDTVFYVDFSPLDGVVDQTFVLDTLEQRRIFDPDNDNTGMHIWATGAFAAAWGVDPRTADTSVPYLDLGITSLPLRQQWQVPVLIMDKTADPTVLPPGGGTVTFTLVVRAFEAALVNVDVTDTLPVGWSYVQGSTQATYSGQSGGAANPAPAIDGRTLFWDLSVELKPRQRLTLTFQAQLTTTATIGMTVYDDLESNDYAGGQNWSGDWQEGGESDGPASGAVVVDNADAFLGSWHLAMTGSNRSISRTVDLNGFISPTLRFARAVSLSVSSEYYLDLYDGTNWTTVLTWTNGGQESVYVQETLDLGLYKSNAAAIRFRSGSSITTGDHLYVDQIEIFDALAININVGEAVGKLEYSDALFNPADEVTVYISPLSLRKTVNLAQANIGNTLVYTLAWANNSASITATQVTLQDIVPVQYTTFVTASSGGVYDGASGVITWNLGTLAPLASGVVTFAVQVNNFVQDGSVIENWARIESNQSIRAASNRAHTLVLAPDVKLSKSGPTVAGQGQVITYTLEYENVGRTNATGVFIRDIVPLSTTYMVNSLAILTGTNWVTLSDAVDGDQGAFIASTLAITPGRVPGTLAAGESGQIRFSVRVSDTAALGALILNWATLDRDLDNPRDSNLLITRISTIIISKSAQQALAAPSRIISYTLIYGNQSSTDVQNNVYVREAIPDYTRLVTGSVYGNAGEQIAYSWDEGATYSTTLPVTPVTHIRWYTPQVPTNTYRTVGFAVRVNDVLPPNTTIQNLAHITSTEVATYIRQWVPSNQVEIETIDLWIDKAADRETVSPGETISFTITFGNGGSAAASGAVITDAIPAATRLIPGSIVADGGVSDGHVVTWSVSPPAQSSSFAVHFAVTVALTATCGHKITNTAYISHGYDAGHTLPVFVTVTAPYTAAFSPSVTETCPAQAVTFTNQSQGAASYTWDLGDGAITTTVSPVYRYSSPGVFTVVLTATTQCGSDVVTDVITVWPPPTAMFTPSVTKTYPGVPITFANHSLGAVGHGWHFGDGAISHVISPVHAYRLPGAYTVTLAVTSTCGYVDTMTRTVYISPPLLTALKSAHPVVAQSGELLTYTIVVSNHSPGRAVGIFVSDTLPLNTQFVSNSINLDPPGAGIVGTAPPALASNVEISGGQGVTITYIVTVAASLPAGVDTITNTVAMTTGYGVTDTDIVTTVVWAAPDLVVVKRSEPTVAAVGQPVTYTLVVSNVGVQGATGVALTDTLPAHTTFAGASGGGAETSPGSGVVYWNLGALGVGERLTRTVMVLVDGTLPGGVTTLTNVARAGDDGGNGPDLQAADNIYTHTLAVEAAPDLAVVKRSEQTVAAAGQPVTYTLVVSNVGTQGATGVALTDTLPAHTTFAGASGGGAETSPGSGVVYWNLGALDAGRRLTRTVMVLVDGVLPGGVTTLTNVARAGDDGSNGPDLQAADNVYTHTLAVEAAPDLAVIKRSEQVVAAAGLPITYTLVVSNVGTQEATGVALTDILPAHTTFAGASGGGAETSPGSGVVYWNLGAIEVGRIVTRVLVVMVDSPLPDHVDFVTNVVAVQDDGGNGADLVLENNVYTWTTEVGYAPVLRMIKEGPGAAAVGERVVFTFTIVQDTVAGDGSAVSGLDVYDDYAGQAKYVAGDDGDARLEQGEAWVYTANYVIRHTDPSPLVNTAIVQGWDRDNDLVTATATHSTTVGYAPVLRVIKAGPETAHVGETIVFTFTVSNVSFVPTAIRGAAGDGSPLTGISVIDDLAGQARYISGDDADGVLEIGEAWLYTASYTILASDPNPLVNTVTASGYDGNGNLVTGADTHRVIITHVPWHVFLPVILLGRR